MINQECKPEKIKIKYLGLDFATQPKPKFLKMICLQCKTRNIQNDTHQTT